jgi:hypothetical protein
MFHSTFALFAALAVANAAVIQRAEADPTVSGGLVRVVEIRDASRHTIVPAIVLVIFFLLQFVSFGLRLFYFKNQRAYRMSQHFAPC